MSRQKSGLLKNYWIPSVAFAPSRMSVLRALHLAETASIIIL